MMYRKARCVNGYIPLYKLQMLTRGTELAAHARCSSASCMAVVSGYRVKDALTTAQNPAVLSSSPVCEVPGKTPLSILRRIH